MKAPSSGADCETHALVLAILIPTVWLTLAAFFVLLCRIAARGDRDVAAASPPIPRITLSEGGRLVLAPSANRRLAAGTCRARTSRRLLATERTERTAHSGRPRS
jgi:hypothetical protein